MGLGRGGAEKNCLERTTLIKIFSQFSYISGHSGIHVIIKETFHFCSNNSMKYILNILTLLIDSSTCAHVNESNFTVKLNFFLELIVCFI